MSVKFSNNGKTELASAISSSDTSINVVDAAVFPSITGSEYFYMTLEDSSSNLEIVKVTGVSSNTLTVTRAQESTTARAFASGDKAENRLTAGGLNDSTAGTDPEFQSVSLPDNGSIYLGDSNDLRIYHSGSHSYIWDTGTGDLILKGSDDLKLQTASGEKGLIVNADASVQMYYDNQEKLTTAATGISVTGGITTSDSSTINGDLTLYQGTPTLTLEDSNSGGGGGAEGKLLWKNTAGNSMGIGITGDVQSSADLYISNNPSGTFGGYLGLDADAVLDSTADIILEPKSDTVLANGGLKMGSTTVLSSARAAQNLTGIDVSGSSTNLVNIVSTDSTADAAYNAVHIDYNASGSDACTADRGHVGLRIDADTSATGGDTSDEYRFYGIHCNAKATGDADLIAGGYFIGEAQQADGGQSTNVYGVYANGIADVESGQINNTYGLYGYALANASSGTTTTNLYGSFGKTLVGATQDTNITRAVGTYGEVEIDTSGASTTLTNAVAVEAQIDNDSDTDVTINNGYLFYGNYAGTRPTTSYGVYIADDVDNYFAGTLGVGTSSPSRTFHSKGASGVNTVAKFESGATSGTETVYVQLSSNGQSATDSGYISYKNTKEMGLWTADTERMTISSSGNVDVKNGLEITGGPGTIAGATFDNGWFRLGTSSQGLTIDTNEMYTSGSGDFNFGALGSGKWKFSTRPRFMNGIDFGDSSPVLDESGHYLRITTSSGYTDIGSGNSSYSHFYTDRGKFYFSKQIDVDSGIVNSYNENLQLRRANSTTNRLTIYSGYSQFSNKLHVATSSSNGGLVFPNSTGPDVQFMATGSTGSTNVSIKVGNTQSSATEEFRFTHTGNFHADGNIYAYSTTTNSDIRLKENVAEIESPLEKLDAIRGVTWDWKRDGKAGAGVIAQEVEEVLPSAVYDVEDLKSDETHKAVDYNQIIGLLVESVKELKAEVERLKKGDD